MKAKASPSAKGETPETYIASLPPERQATVRSLHEAIQKAAPSLEPAMVSGMIGYGKFHYRYDSGREGDWFIVGLCSRSAGVSLYVCSQEKGKYLAEQHAAALGKVKVGRSCISFKKLEDLNLPEAMRVVRRAEELGGAGAVM